MHTTDIHGRPWQPCAGCPHPTPGSCRSRSHRAYCDHYRDNPAVWGPIIAAEPPEDRPPRPGPAPPYRPAPRQPGRINLGLVLPNLAQGGVERWGQTLAAALPAERYRVVGAVAGSAAFPDADLIAWFEGRGIPTGVGPEALRALAGGCDLLLGSGVVELGAWLGEDAWPCPVVAISHGSSEWARASVAWSARASARVAVSTAAAEVFGADGLPVRVIENIPHAPPARRDRATVRARWGISESAKVLGYVGRWSPEKRPEALLEALSHLPGWSGVAIGPYQDRADIPDPLRGRVVLAGTSDDVTGDLQALDSLLLASPSEGYALVIAEAWAAGCPVISTPVGCVRDYPDLARVVPVGASGAEIARAILADVADPAGTLARVARARAYARDHLTPERFAREWDTLLSGLAPPVRPPGPRTAIVPSPPPKRPQRPPEPPLPASVGVSQLLPECRERGEQTSACRCEFVCHAGKGRSWRPDRVNLNDCLRCGGIA